jgi:hypothetical protein
MCDAGHGPEGSVTIRTNLLDQSLITHLLIRQRYLCILARRHPVFAIPCLRFPSP